MTIYVDEGYWQSGYAQGEPYESSVSLPLNLTTTASAVQITDGSISLSTALTPSSTGLRKRESSVAASLSISNTTSGVVTYNALSAENFALSLSTSVERILLGSPQTSGVLTSNCNGIEKWEFLSDSSETWVPQSDTSETWTRLVI